MQVAIAGFVGKDKGKDPLQDRCAEMRGGLFAAHGQLNAAIVIGIQRVVAKNGFADISSADVGTSVD
eukprot:2751381-Pyramimonas_sp.AAC.1